MQILSINVSEPKKIMFNGKELITSIYKKLKKASVEFGEIGLKEDIQPYMKFNVV